MYYEHKAARIYGNKARKAGSKAKPEVHDEEKVVSNDTSLPEGIKQAAGGDKAAGKAVKAAKRGAQADGRRKVASRAVKPAGSRIHPRIEEYMLLVEGGKIRACKEQHQLVKLVRKAFRE